MSRVLGETKAVVIDDDQHHHEIKAVVHKLIVGEQELFTIATAGAQLGIGVARRKERRVRAAMLALAIATADSVQCPAVLDLPGFEALVTQARQAGVKESVAVSDLPARHKHGGVSDGSLIKISRRSGTPFKLPIHMLAAAIALMCATWTA